MAVPKRKKSYMKSKIRYQINNKKIFFNRTITLNEFDIYYKMQKKFPS